MTTATLPGLERGTAVFSPCGVYRYRLTRRFDIGVGRCVFCMLNPSTATAEIDDPSIRRCIAFARRWGYGALEITNIFALRSTDPRGLKKVDDPIGPENDRHIVEAARTANLLVCAWGTHGKYRERDRAVMDLLLGAGIEPHCLDTTDELFPSHPLYLAGHVRPTPYRGRPA